MVIAIAVDEVWDQEVRRIKNLDTYFVSAVSRTILYMSTKSELYHMALSLCQFSHVCLQNM